MELGAMTWEDMEPGCTCGSIKGVTIKSSRDPAGFRVRLIRCSVCGLTYTFAGGRIPISFWLLDDAGRRQRRDWKRERNGFAGGPARKVPVPELAMRVRVPKGIDKRQRTGKTGGPTAED